jgi:hypothetical protein
MFNLEINLSLDAILASFKKMANTGGGGGSKWSYMHGI